MASDKQRKPNTILRWQRDNRGWSLRKVADLIYDLSIKDGEGCGITGNLVSRWERGEIVPSPFYREKLCQVYDCTVEELGLLGEYLISAALAPQPETSTKCSQTAEVIALAESGHEQQKVFPSLPTPEQDIIGEAEQLEEQDMDPLRRQITRQSFKLAGAAIVIPQIAILDSDIADRLSKALSKPFTVDDITLRDLEAQIKNCWQCRDDGLVDFHALYNHSLDLLQKIAILLEGSLLPSTRVSLCSIASRSSLLIGTLLFDKGRYVQARKFQELALQAASEADNKALQSICWGWMSFTWTYSQKHVQALSCLQRARPLAAQHANASTQAWLAAVEAEIQANLQDQDSCLQALNSAALVEHQPVSQAEDYIFHFDRSLLTSYRSTCSRKLFRSDNHEMDSFLKIVQQALCDALAEPELAARRRPIYLVDLASTFAQQGELEGAYNYGMQAMVLISKIQAQPLLQRLSELHYHLAPWKDTQQVRDFDENLMQLLMQSEGQYD